MCRFYWLYILLLLVRPVFFCPYLRAMAHIVILTLLWPRELRVCHAGFYFQRINSALWFMSLQNWSYAPALKQKVQKTACLTGWPYIYSIFFVITRCYVKILGSSWNEMNHFAVQVATCSVRYVRCKRNIVIIRKHVMLIILSRTNNIILVKDRRGSLTIEFVLNGAWSFLMP